MTSRVKKRVISLVCVFLVFAVIAPVALARYQYIESLGYSAYKYQGKIAFSADCQGNTNVNCVEIVLIVQYWNGSKWVNVDEDYSCSYGTYGILFFSYQPTMDGDYRGRVYFTAHHSMGFEDVPTYTNVVTWS